MAGTQPGRVFVDHADDPTAVVMLSDFCYFSGNPGALDLQSDVVDLLESEVMPRRDYLLLFSFSEGWQAALQSVFRPYETRVYERSTFEFDARRFQELHSGWQQRIPAGFSLRRLDAATALEVGGIPDLWGSLENFLARGFGFCAIDESKPDARSGFAGSAQTVFVGDRHAETGVGVREAYRRKGLGMAVCCAFIDHCLQSGICPDWGCVLNEASETLAYRMGYVARHNWQFLYVRTPDRLRKKM